MTRLEHMNDTKNIPEIITFFSKGLLLSSSEVASLTANKQSLVTIKRQLAILTKEGYLEQSGAGRSVKYTITKKGRLLKLIDVQYIRKSTLGRLRAKLYSTFC